MDESEVATLRLIAVAIAEAGVILLLVVDLRRWRRADSAHGALVPPEL